MPAKVILMRISPAEGTGRGMSVCSSRTSRPPVWGILMARMVSGRVGRTWLCRCVVLVLLGIGFVDWGSERMSPRIERLVIYKL